MSLCNVCSCVVCVRSRAGKTVETGSGSGARFLGAGPGLRVEPVIRGGVSAQGGARGGVRDLVEPVLRAGPE